ncbi:phospho-sugar mutase [Gracilibacillus alcaliphilus]|uniref:phospho-sugar mutase n=1 Tax=Gracilibacillus alcaliphilus TaxID=1401441 RepID=UPI0019562695|nr:phospho-sugar mutase [Gracilibacillus alcaliphilus]MBM7677265.1 phosphoglucomutase [Gracilibacillus alcaliphilus]
MNWQDNWRRWNTFADLEPALQQELAQMADKEATLEDAFYTNLSFGTAGMRGVLGPGTNRMNIYTVRKAVEGLANHIKKKGEKAQKAGVVIAYDSRYMSQEFAIEAARVLGVHQIKTYIFESLRPTPLLSFAVRYLHTAAGIMITASHNPPEYNGFKVYNADGGQMLSEEAAALVHEVSLVKDELAIPVLSQQQAEQARLLEWIGQEVDQAYLKEVTTIRKQVQDNQLQVVFTPLHGTAHDLVLAGLTQLGIDQVHVVKEQAEPDPDFSTVVSPNPEEHQAFELAIEQGTAIGADILIGTDPDADRLGVAVRQADGSFSILSGNQLGALLLDYTLSQISEDQRKDGVFIKTIVTTELGRAIADYYRVETMNTLTGFKYIGEKIKQFETEKRHFLLGYEESYGYLIGDFVRDKDAVQIAVAVCEMANFWKRKGETLLTVLEKLYQRHGFYMERLDSLTLKGKEGAAQITKILEDIREHPFQQLGGLAVLAIEDFQSGKRQLIAAGEEEHIDLPTANVVKFLLEQDTWVCFRPSGTEPKMKSYFGVKTDSREASNQLLEQIQAEVTARIEAIIK